MKFCMVTTFFGGHSFGGDAAYVDRLCQALCRRGHEVHVYYCVDAFNAVRGDHPLREYTPTPGLHLHPLESAYGILSPLATQATGTVSIVRTPTSCTFTTSRLSGVQASSGWEPIDGPSGS
jgi:hypothetical protein